MKTFFLFIIFINLIGTLQAQNANIRQLRFNHLFLKDGLVESQVYQMEQDKEGYMWFGTRTGLVRFDGYTPKTYQFQTKIIPRSNISAVYKDKKDELWAAAAYEGLFYYDRANDTFVHCKADSLNEKLLQSSIIKKIQDDADGNLWLNLLNKTNSVLGGKDAYETVMLYTIKTQRFTNFSNTEKDNQYIKYKQYLSPLVTDQNGNVWCGSDSGLYKYDKKRNRFKPEFANDSLSQLCICELAVNPANPELIWFVANNQLMEYGVLQKKIIVKPDSGRQAISQLLFDSNNQLWFSGSKGLSCFDDKVNKFVNYKGDPTGEFKVDLSGNFWCLTSKGLSYFDKKTKTFTKYAKGQDPGSLFPYPYLIFIDKNGTVWISVSAGVQWLSKQSSSIEKRKMPGNIPYRINAVAESADSTFWLATDVGLYHWIPKTDSFINLTPKNRYNGDFGSVLSGSNNNIWFGGSGENNGVFCYNTIGKKTIHYKYDENDTASVSGARIGDLLEDKKGNIWIGTWSGGLCKLDIKTKKIKRFPFIINFEKTPNENKLDDKDALSLYQDKTGILWIGTNAGSLNRFDEKTQSFVSFQNTSNIFRCIVNINEDEKSRLWASTYAAGLFLVDRKREAVKNISIKDGLLSNNSGGLIIDADNNIWLNSAKGISIYNPETGSIRTVNNEIVQLDFAPFCSFKTRQGAFIFPANNGFVMINPNDFKTDSITPIVHIESVIYNKSKSKNKSVDSTIVRFGKTRLNLSYDENRITFNYVGLIYQNVEQVRYRYKLDGYNNNWVNANTQRSVIYNNLAPGTYIFHVTASNGDGVWSWKDDSIMIVIAPPFWQTWWFRTLLVLSLAGFIILAVKAYLNKKLRVQQEEFIRLKGIEKLRTKISMDIHDEISSGLTKISMLSQRVKIRFENKKEVEPEIIDKIAGSSREVIANLGEIIWAVNPKHDNLPSLLAYIRNYSANFFEESTVRLTICFPDVVMPLNVSPDIKHNLFLVIKEALNNIVKHAAATEVTMQFSCSNERYQFIIRDNGKGLADMNGSAFGNGLTNMKKRMAVIHGNISLQSKDNTGTVVTMEEKFV